MQIATTITDSLVESFGLVSANITIALTQARLNGSPTADLYKRQYQVRVAWDAFIDEKNY